MSTTPTNDALAAARAAFEKWAKRQHRLASVSWVQFRDGKPPHPMGRDVDEVFCDRDLNDEWEAWQAASSRAAAVNALPVAGGDVLRDALYLLTMGYDIAAEALDVDHWQYDYIPRTKSFIERAQKFVKEHAALASAASPELREAAQTALLVLGEAGDELVRLHKTIDPYWIAMSGDVVLKIDKARAALASAAVAKGE